MQNSKQLRKHKNRLKSSMTKSELIFKDKLISEGVDYKPQMILGFYILDFCIPLKMLDIEIDGQIHADRANYDKMRDNFVKKCGFNVIRVKNEEANLFDLNIIKKFPDKTLKEFRSGLAKANSLRSKAIQSLAD